MEIMFSVSICCCCNEPTRKWILEDVCYSMCVNSDCIAQDICRRDIANSNNFKIIANINI